MTDPKRCHRHHIDRDESGGLTTTQCRNLPVNGTGNCLEHAEPAGAARPVLPSPYTTEAPPKPARCLCQVVPVEFDAERPQRRRIRRLFDGWFA